MTAKLLAELGSLFAAEWARAIRRRDLSEARRLHKISTELYARARGMRARGQQ